MDRKEMALFQKSGLLSENKYYLFIPRRPGDEVLLKKYPSSFERSDSHWFISFDHMRELKKEDLLILRGRDIEGISSIAFLIVSILIIHFGLNFLQVYAMEVAGQKMVHDLRMKLFSHLQNLSVSFLTRTGWEVGILTGPMISRMFMRCLLLCSSTFKDILLLIGIIVLLLHLQLGVCSVSFSIL
jgi:ABC-type multidrug transport system fused ATPase/permease subunit